MMRFSAILTLAVLILHTACAAAQPDTNLNNEVKIIRDTRMYSSPRCLYAADKRFLPAIAAAVVPALIEKSLTRFSAAIRKAGEKSVKTVAATSNVEVSAGDLPACIQIIYGDFYLDKSDFNEASFVQRNPLLLREDARKNAYNSLLNAGAYLADKPLLIFEGYVRKSQDGSAIALGPTALMYDSLLDSDINERKKGTRDLVVSFTISAAGAAGSQDKGTLGQLTFHRMATGSILRFNDRAPEAPWIPIQLTDKKSPRTVTLSVSETKDANEFLLFIADVLDGSKDQVETVLKQTLIESERLKVKQQEIEAEKQKQQVYIQALTDSIDAESDARVALLDFEEAARSADLMPNDLVKKREVIKKASVAYGKLLGANLKARNAAIGEPFKSDVIEAVRSRLSQ